MTDITDSTDSYFTIAHAGEGTYREKMSRFLAFAIPIHDADEAKTVIKEYQNRYHDSRHVCWAYMIGPERTDWQLNDNGEPSGTAGKPILGQINSAEVTDLVVIVVRYFGGIKLGTSGLIAAYREAARLAIEDAGRRELFQTEDIRIQFPYATADGAMRIAKGEGVEIVSQEFDNLCRLHLRVRASLAPEIRGRLTKVEGLCFDL